MTPCIQPLGRFCETHLPISEFCKAVLCGVQVYLVGCELPYMIHGNVGYRSGSLIELTEPVGYAKGVVQRPLATIVYFCKGIAVPRVKVNTRIYKQRTIHNGITLKYSGTILRYIMVLVYFLHRIPG